ncbi:Uncharacterised protein [Bordetella pertussis]|nr:Uncharacterised protein [Bordetella pertussis]
MQPANTPHASRISPTLILFLHCIVIPCLKGRRIRSHGFARHVGSTRYSRVA